MDCNVYYIYMAMWALANAEQQATAKMEGILWGGRV
jgi:hypothetical protein